MRRPRILISDDDPLVMRSLSRLAERSGLEVIEDPGQAAVALARRTAPDVILVDIHQPGIDGRNLLLQLKDAPETEKIEVFVMSGLPQPYTRAECLMLGALEFLAKPIDLDMFEFVSRVAHAARDAEHRRPPRSSPGSNSAEVQTDPMGQPPAPASTRSTSFGPPVPISSATTWPPR